VAISPIILDELQTLKRELVGIPQVELAYATSTRDSLSVVIVIPDKNADVQQKLIDLEAQIIDAFPSLAVDFEGIFRCGRAANELVSPQGIRLVAR
jgi:hypothetical protein